MADRENSTFLKHWGLSYLANVCVVQGSIHFIQHKERGGTKAKIQRRSSLVFSHIKNICIYSQIILYKKPMYFCCFSPVNGKDQSESSDGLLSSWQVVHGHESFPRSHAVIVDAIKVRLIWILRTENGLLDMCVQKVSYNKNEWTSHWKSESSMDLSAGVSAEILVDLVDDDRHAFKALTKEMEAFGLHLLKLLTAFLCGVCAGLKRWGFLSMER